MSQVHDIDHELVRQLARKERDGGCADAPEIGRRIARSIAQSFADGEDGAYENLIGLAAQGATYYGRGVLKENRLKIKRRGNVVTISGAYALPSAVVSDGDGAVAAEAPAIVSAEVTGVSLYVQLDYMTWVQFHTVLDLLRARHGAIGETITTFEEVAKLEDRFPEATVGEAIERAGLDLGGRNIDLDILTAVAS